ncbi:hypothetical protein ACFWPK_28275 [Nocardia sp. NPDC058519]|uniref:hypothetical protein n=1 Tax=Nocardia sp. NPDC058519 TaxID=3346535 RepID=UPI0036679817
MFGIHPIIDYINNVETVEQAGGQVPANYRAILNRWREYQNIEKPNREALIQAIIDHKSNADLGELKALALAEMVGQVDESSLYQELQPPTFIALRNAYQAVAETNYTKLAKAWAEKATEFTNCADVIDPATPAAHLMHANDEIRSAWSRGQTLSVELTSMMAPVIAAAELAGVQIGMGLYGAPATFALFAKPGPKGRRNAWDAWNSDNRWNELNKLGIKIEASTLADHTPYRQPMTMEWIPGAINRQVDPEIEIESNL